MKKILGYLFIIVVCGFIIYYRKPISTYLYKKFIFKQEIILTDPNEYKKTDEFLYVQETDDFYPKNYDDVLDVIYTTINNGWSEFSFYCDDSYDSCYDDINTIAKDDDILGNINNFVDPYNTFNTISLSINTFNKVTITIDKVYSENDIETINTFIDARYKELIKDSMSDYDKIKKIHDYIINNTIYDKEKEATVLENGVSNYKYRSNTAYGAFFNGRALCGGYTDAMALFLDKMNIPNYRISSENHIWNLVYINGEWKHLDLTWDDPVTSSGDNILTHKFFLVTTKQLFNLDNEQHNYDSDVCLEAK